MLSFFFLNFNRCHQVAFHKGYTLSPFPPNIKDYVFPHILPRLVGRILKYLLVQDLDIRTMTAFPFSTSNFIFQCPFPVKEESCDTPI